MDLKFKELFLHKWKQYFPGSDLPITFFFSDTIRDAEPAKRPRAHSCIICELSRVLQGVNLAYRESSISCLGARRYLGFTTNLRVNFEYFLSCGIPGVLDGERYMRTPEQVREFMKSSEFIPRQEEYIIFKRWDTLESEDNPVAVIFFATPDVLSGLFTLTNYDRVYGEGVVAPFGSGCGAIVHYPYFENQKPDPHAVLGMFDVSARACVPDNTLSFAVPMKKFVRMVPLMDESFLGTTSWKKVAKRLVQTS
jgi:hypothetical protein